MCVHRTRDKVSIDKYQLSEFDSYNKSVTIKMKKKQKIEFKLLKNLIQFVQKNEKLLITATIILPILSLPHLSYAAPAAGNIQPVPMPKDIGPTVAPVKGKPGFINGFVSSLSMILVSEIGDKTFFIAAVMAMRHSRIQVFLGAITALAFMTVLSALFGYVTTVIPRIYTYYVSTALFALFGFKMLYEGIMMTDEEGAEELEEVQNDLRQKEENENTPLTPSTSSNPPPSKTPSTIRRILFSCFSRVYLQATTLTFLAEFGDRSQLATIVLAARENIVGICIGGVLGHCICTGLAVLGGRIIAQRISVKTVTIIGGIVFLTFAVVSLFLSPN